MIALSKNINKIQIHVGSFTHLIKDYNLKSIIFKEHPLNAHYKGVEDNRDWMFENKDNLIRIKTIIEYLIIISIVYYIFT